MSKWIKWEGGECPVAAGTLVDVRYRDGRSIDGVKAGVDTDGMTRDAGLMFWSNDAQDNDIIAYRLHTEPQSNPITHKALAKLHAKLDRIERKLDLVIGRPLIDWGTAPAFMVPDEKPVKAEAEPNADAEMDWKRWFKPYYAKKCLSNGYKGDALTFAFDWDHGMGRWDWNIEDVNLRAGRPISNSARAELIRMIAEYEATH